MVTTTGGSGHSNGEITAPYVIFGLPLRPAQTFHPGRVDPPDRRSDADGEVRDLGNPADRGPGELRQRGGRRWPPRSGRRVPAASRSWVRTSCGVRCCTSRTGRARCPSGSSTSRHAPPGTTDSTWSSRGSSRRRSTATARPSTPGRRARRDESLLPLRGPLRGDAAPARDEGGRGARVRRGRDEFLVAGPGPAHGSRRAHPRRGVHGATGPGHGPPRLRLGLTAPVGRDVIETVQLRDDARSRTASRTRPGARPVVIVPGGPGRWDHLAPVAELVGIPGCCPAWDRASWKAPATTRGWSAPRSSPPWCGTSSSHLDLRPARRAPGSPRSTGPPPRRAAAPPARGRAPRRRPRRG